MIQKLRLKRGWSQQQLAEASGLSVRTVQRMEAGLLVNWLVTPDSHWAYWVIAGWGVGILLHALRVFMPDLALGPEWERRQVEKRLGWPLS